MTEREELRRFSHFDDLNAEAGGLPTGAEAKPFMVSHSLRYTVHRVRSECRSRRAAHYTAYFVSDKVVLPFFSYPSHHFERGGERQKNHLLALVC